MIEKNICEKCKHCRHSISSDIVFTEMETRCDKTMEIFPIKEQCEHFEKEAVK